MLEVVVATNSTALADPIPGPGECDQKCRERRFYQGRYYDTGQKQWITKCLISKYRDCGFCTGPDSQCSPSQLDMYPSGKCDESTRDQYSAKTPLTPCTALCNLPVELVAYYREAAEGPNTYSSVDEWVLATGVKVLKCTQDGKTQTWEDEK